MKGGFLILIVFLFIGCTAEDTSVKTLESVEIQNYEGKKLSSIRDFRENSIRGPQYIDVANYSLVIDGLVENKLELSYSEIVDGHQKYEKVVTLDCVEGWSATILWEGLLLRELLEKTNPLDSANTIILYAEDGYSTSFPIEYIMDQDIMMAYRMNNLTMIPERGYPFQLVAESKWGYKWIKWITRIEFSDDTEYEGFWEKRGYSNSADLNDSFFS